MKLFQYAIHLQSFKEIIRNEQDLFNKMEIIYKLQLRELTEDFMKINFDKPSSFIKNHCMNLAVAKSTVYDIIKHVEQRKGMKHSGPGRSAVKITEERKRKVIKSVNNRMGSSQRYLVRKLQAVAVNFSEITS